MTGKYLITTNNWFIAPDGNQYRAVWGDVKILDDNGALGIKTNRNSTNWFACVGHESTQVLIAGCQIHYAIKCENKPNTDDVPDITIHDGKLVSEKLPTKIYLAE